MKNTVLVLCVFVGLLGCTSGEKRSEKGQSNKSDAPKLRSEIEKLTTDVAKLRTENQSLFQKIRTLEIEVTSLSRQSSAQSNISKRQLDAIYHLGTKLDSALKRLDTAFKSIPIPKYKLSVIYNTQKKAPQIFIINQQTGVVFEYKGLIKSWF